MKTYLETDLEKRPCHACGAKPDTIHLAGCDAERCPECGWQLSSCDCFTDETWPTDADRLPWTGIGPGVVECVELGWYVKWQEADRKWVKCEKDDPKAVADLNRLFNPWGEAYWDRKLKRWVLRK